MCQGEPYQGRGEQSPHFPSLDENLNKFPDFFGVNFSHGFNRFHDVRLTANALHELKNPVSKSLVDYHLLNSENNPPQGVNQSLRQRRKELSLGRDYVRKFFLLWFTSAIILRHRGLSIASDHFS